MQQDPQFGSFILEPIEILGVDAFTDWSVQLKLRIKTVPLKQWEVGRELRKRIRQALEEHGVQVPFPAIAAVPPPPTNPEPSAPAPRPRLVAAGRSRAQASDPSTPARS